METAFLEKSAIEAASQGTWQKAIELNQKILKNNPQNIPALNRLARAFGETGNLILAKKIYQKVLTIDKYNPIATKNLKRLADKRKKIPGGTKQLPSAEVFLEEPRKTKVVRVIRLTSPQILAEIDSGDKVVLTAKKRFIAVNRPDGIHLGCLPEDLSQRLSLFIRGGNRYEAFVKNVDRQHLEILIREISRGQRYQNSPSF